MYFEFYVNFYCVTFDYDCVQRYCCVETNSNKCNKIMKQNTYWGKKMEQQLL